MSVVLQDGRPVLPITDGLVLPDGFVSPNRRGAAAETAVALARSVGRVVMLGDPRFDFIGTAFVVGPRHALTARHVTDLFKDDAKDGPKHVVRFGARPDDDAGFTILSVLRHPTLHVAVLELDTGGGELPPPLVLDGREPLEPGLPVAVLGIHMLDSSGRIPLNVLTKFEGPAIGSKTVAPGHVFHVEAAKLTYSAFSGARSIAHDCTTLGGSAGAPLVGLDDGAAVLGIHFAGFLFERNYAVPASELARDQRMREFVTFSAGSVAVDPVASAQAWGEPVSVGQPQPAPAPDAVASLVASVDAALVRKFGEDLDAALDFISDYGAAWRQAVEAQPGRGRIADSKFRHAVVERLVRRGLVDDGFRASLGLSATPDEVLTPETLAALKALSIDAAAVQDLVFGSPMINVLAPTGVVEPWPELVARLNVTGTQGRDALDRLLTGMGVIHPASAQEVVDKARAELALAGGTAELAIPGESGAEPRGEDVVGIDFLQRGAVAARSVCLVRLAQNGMAERRAGSSGWLLAADLVVAPAHLAPLPESGGLPQRDALDPDLFTVEFRDGGPNDPVWRFAVEEVASLDLRTNIMILRLASPVEDRAPLQLRAGPAIEGPIAAIHHPHLGPKVLSYVGARLIAADEHLVRYLCATSPGSGGAPIFDQDWRVLATHLASTIVQGKDGRDIAVKTGCSVQALVEHIRAASADPALWQRVVAAQTMLRSVDIAFNDLLGDDAAPAVITVLGDLSNATLRAIDGLTLVSRDDTLVSATVTRAAVDQLAQTPGVVAVTASQPAARVEAARSLPFVGVPLDRAGIGEGGEGCLVALIDDGIDPFHKTFFTANAVAADGVGSSRIELYWDQTNGAPIGQPAMASGAAAAFVGTYELKGGTLYVGADFDTWRADPPAALRGNVEHGTAVASIAAGRPLRPPGSAFCGGMAPLSPLLVIRYDDDRRGYEQSHVDALTLIERYAHDRGLPVVVNISSGTNLGAHDGSSIVERRCTTFCEAVNRVIVKSAGNEGRTFRHRKVAVVTANPTIIAWRAPPALSADADQLELWFRSSQGFQFVVVDPLGMPSTPILADGEPVDEIMSGSDHLVARYEKHSSLNSSSRVEIRLSPAEGAAAGVSEGKWQVYVYPLNFTGQPTTIHTWLKQRRGETLDGPKLQFDNGDQGYSITIPGNAEKVITVAAMEAALGADLFPDNSRGPTSKELMKPDLLAPGMHIQAALAGADDATATAMNSGTSYAAPLVTGAVALALSLFHKARLAHPELDGQLRPESHLIMTMLKDSAADFILEGHNERGFGRLDAASFLKAVRERIRRITTAAHPPSPPAIAASPRPAAPGPNPTAPPQGLG